MKPANSKGVTIPSQKLHFGMLKPRKSVSMGKGDTSSSCRSIWAFNLFMRDFRKSEELESMIIKAGHEKWHSMTESEQGSYEKRLEERSLEFEKCYQIYKKLIENVDEAETQEHQEMEG